MAPTVAKSRSRSNAGRISVAPLYPSSTNCRSGGTGVPSLWARSLSAAVVETLVETLSHRQISVVGEEFAVSKDAMEMFGVLDLETSFEGCRFAVGIRNANNKRFRFGMHGGAASVRVSQSRVSRRLQPSWRNTRSGSRLKMLCRLAWTGCSETLNLCGGRWRAGEPSR